MASDELAGDCTRVHVIQVQLLEFGSMPHLSLTVRHKPPELAIATKPRIDMPA
jgi:hypothetical protein